MQTENHCYAFFDVDHTLLAGSTGKFLAELSVRRGVLPYYLLFYIPIFYYRYRTGRLDPRTFQPFLRRFKGFNREEIENLAGEVFQKKLKPRLYVEALELIQKERESGKTVVLATSGPEVLVKPLAEYLGVENIIATQLKVEAGQLTGEFLGEPAFGQGKQRKVRQYLERHRPDFSCCSFYSDSHYDLPLLEQVEKPIAVNPDGKLLKVAREKGWEILRLKKVLGKMENYNIGSMHSGS